MGRISFLLSSAVSNGRTRRVLTREQILAALLRKRAMAWQMGDTDQEQKLREQIRWALPVRIPEDSDLGEVPRTVVGVED